MHNDLEKLAALEHERYVISVTSFLSQIEKDYQKGIIKSIPEISEYYNFRYRNMWKEYSDLSESKKSYGRSWAKRILKVLGGGK